MQYDGDMSEHIRKSHNVSLLLYHLVCPDKYRSIIFKEVLWEGEFWTKGYYINTVGKAGNEEAIQKYVQQQGMEYTQLHRDQLKLFEGF